MIHDFSPGDFLIFQIESGYGLLRVLAVDDTADGAVWHLAAYEDLFLEPEDAEAAITGGSPPRLRAAHLALTNRAFESTQVAMIAEAPLEPELLSSVENWRASESSAVSDRSVRLLLGLR